MSYIAHPVETAVPTPPERFTSGADYTTAGTILGVLGPFETRPRVLPAQMSQGWRGRVGLDLLGLPDAEAAEWLRALIDHGRGTALVRAATDAEWFAECVWEAATAALFLRGRLEGHETERALAAPVVVVAFGMEDAWHLERAGIPGRVVPVVSAVTAARRTLTPISPLSDLA